MRADPPSSAPEGARDDEIIAKAFRWSAWIFFGIAALIAGVVWVMTRKETAAPIDERPVTPAREQVVERDPPSVRFTDITAASGITFVHTNGASGRKLLPETMGPGCGAIDYDGDGDEDLLFVNARAWEDADADTDSDEVPRTLALFANDGKGRFHDVTTATGLVISLYGMGVAIGDCDGDADDDIFVTAVGANRLLRNDAGRFSDVTAEAGVAGGESTWSTSAAFFDGDNDGDLDLFVCNYVVWSRDIDERLDYRLTGVGRAYGPPTDYEGTQPYYYRNEGNGRFVEAGADAGLHITTPTGMAAGKALGVLPFDIDRDGWIDVIVANDTVANFLFLNRGSGRFEESGRIAGIAFDGNGAATGAMGIDASYYRNDLTLGIGIGNFATETSSLFVSDSGEPFFSDEALAEGIGAVSRQMLSFGLFFFDYDLDGRFDLFQTNGHLEEEINKVQPSQHYAQPSQLFWNAGADQRSCFVPVDPAIVGDLAKPIVGRAAIYADLDADGDLDIVVTQVGRAPILLRNDLESANGWLRIRLRGPGANWRAIGAVVEVDAGGVTQRQQVMPARSYLASVEATLTFGLGVQARATDVRVRWPGSAESVSYGPQDGKRTIVLDPH